MYSVKYFEDICDNVESWKYLLNDLKSCEKKKDLPNASFQGKPGYRAVL